MHWSNGGPTSLDNMVLLCSHHHHLLHHGDWETRFERVDPDRAPRSNIRL
ncbi:hypothetical protein [Allokutzneria albata]